MNVWLATSRQAQLIVTWYVHVCRVQVCSVGSIAGGVWAAAAVSQPTATAAAAGAQQLQQ